ncbi:hypothetical protein [Micromonospora sp. WMMD737]|uniref:hypothetical protein n=1 Tax=Micromonospora sp. WMMD737 TaxID=3404113 RepID=UPI003B933F93
MGQIGHLIRVGNKAKSAIAIGLAFGTAAGPSLRDFIFILRFGVNPATSQLILPAACQALIALLIIAWAIAIRRRQINWLLLIAASTTSCLCVALAWEAVQLFRTNL